ncbi:hypothetical protein MAPG_12070, partial [Magnaporthiopsis poae ATCC 64411]
MPRGLRSDIYTITTGLENEAGAALEALANEGNRQHALRRFERDEPPPYESPTEPEESDEVPARPYGHVLDGAPPAQDLSGGPSFG